MIVLLWLVSLVLVVLGGLITVANWTIPCRPGGGSLIPVIGGGFLAVGFLVIPFEPLQGFWWLPLLLDLGCVPMLALTAGHLVVWSFRTRKPDQ